MGALPLLQDRVSESVRREKLCRVKASLAERNVYLQARRVCAGDNTMKAACKSAAVAQQTLEARARVQVQLAMMKAALPQQARLLAPIQDVADELEDACFQAKGMASERAWRASEQASRTRKHAGQSVRQAAKVQSLLRQATLASHQAQGELLAAADGRGPRRSRTKPRLTAEERAARKRAAAEQAEAAVRLQAAVRGRGERRTSLRARGARRRRLDAEVEEGRAVEEVALAERAVTAARAHVVKCFAAKTPFSTDAAMTALAEAEAVVVSKKAAAAEAAARIEGAIAMEEAIVQAEQEERERWAAQQKARAAEAEAEALREAAILAEMEELRVLDLMEQRRKTEEKRARQREEMERAKARMVAQTQSRLRVETAYSEQRREEIADTSHVRRERRAALQKAETRAPQKAERTRVCLARAADARGGSAAGSASECSNLGAW